MSKPVNKTAIGAFVVGAILIAAATLAVMGSGTFFAQKRYCVSFFEGSVQGLSVGAPVKLRGVEVGTVTKIQLTVSAVEEDGKTTRQFSIPVFYELYDQQFSNKELSNADFKKIMEHMVRNGLRAQMQMQSIITGQYFVQLDFYPNDAPVFVYESMVNKPEDMENVMEIPAVTTGLAKLSQTINKLPLEDMLNRLNDSLKGLENILNSDSTKDMVAQLGPMAKSLNSAVKTLEDKLGPALESVTGAAQGLEQNSQQLGAVFDGIHVVLGNVDRSINGLTGEIKRTMITLQDASAEISDFAAGESPLSNNLASTLKELRQLSFNLNALVNVLENDPSTLVWGK